MGRFDVIHERTICYLIRVIDLSSGFTKVKTLYTYDSAVVFARNNMAKGVSVSIEKLSIINDWRD